MEQLESTEATTSLPSTIHSISSKERDASEELENGSATAFEPTTASSSNPQFFHTRVNDRHVPQMPTPTKKQSYDKPDDYEQQFPEDGMFEETGPNARVWRTYLIESKAHDENIIGEARDGLDALLVFAGLFSGVVTSFVVQTSQNLQKDPTDVSASLLAELIAVQRAAANGTPVAAVPSSLLSLTSDFVPNALDVWVNGLWFLSLALNLVVALGAVLVKQWLHRYVARRSGTPKEQSHMRQFRFDGLEKWKVLAITGWLPIIMHLSLGLFLVGLILFVNPLKNELSWALTALAGVVYVLYLITNALPVIFVQCPYQTPLSDFLRAFLKFKHLKRDAQAHLDDIVSIKALHWLFGACLDPSGRTIVQQAIGGLPMTAIQKVAGALDEHYADIFRLLRLCCTPNPTAEVGYQARVYLESETERLMRSSLLWHWDQKLSTALSQDGHTLRVRRPIGRITFPITGQSENHSRYMLTSLAYNSGNMMRGRPVKGSAGVMPVADCLQAILSHHHVSHQPFIWLTIIRNLMSVGGFSDIQKSPVFIKILLPIMGWNNSPPPRIESSAVASNALSMAEAIRLYMRDEFCNHLLTRCGFQRDEEGTEENGTSSDHRNAKLAADGEVTAAARVLMMTMELGLHSISTHSSTDDECSMHWNNIGYVLSQFCACDFSPDNDGDPSTNDNYDLDANESDSDSDNDSASDDDDDSDSDDENVSENTVHPSELAVQAEFLRRFVVRLIEETSICGSQAQGSEAMVEHRLLVLKVYSKTRPRDHKSLQSGFASIRGAVEGVLSDITTLDLPIDPIVTYPAIAQILALALQGRCVAAYDIVAKYDCLYLLAAFESEGHKSRNHRECSRSHIARRFVAGLVTNAVDSDEDIKARCTAYLQQNLRQVILHLMTESICENHVKPRDLPVKDLARLLPDKELWRDLRRWLGVLLSWLGSDQQTVPALAELGDESMHKLLVKILNSLDAYWIGNSMSKEAFAKEFVVKMTRLLIKLLEEMEAMTEAAAARAQPRSVAAHTAASVLAETDGASRSSSRAEQRTLSRIRKVIHWREASLEASPDSIELPSATPPLLP